MAAAILLLGFLAHSNVLGAPFKALDDKTTIVLNADIRDLANIPKIFTSSFFGGKHYYRPLVSLSHMIEYRFAGLRPFYYHLTNLALHLSIALTVFALISRITGSRTAGFCTSLLFAVHPVQWEAVANIPDRAVLLSTLFTLGAFYCYCLSSQKRFMPYYGISLLFFALGLLSKESAAMLPVLLISYMLLVERDRLRPHRIVPYFLVIGLYLAIRFSLGITEVFPWHSPRQYFLGFFTFLRACLTYLRLVVWPAGLYFDRARPVFLSFGDPGLWGTVIALAVLVWLLIKFRSRLTPAGWFFLSWFVIELIPVSQLMTSIGVQPGVISTAEHFLYMPVIGLFALAALAGQRLYVLAQEKGFCSAALCRAVAGAVVVTLMTVTSLLSINTRSAKAMFERSLRYNPGNARVLNAMGLELAGEKRFREAEQYFRRSLKQDPADVTARVALGRTLHEEGRFVEAVEMYETVRNPGEQLAPLLKVNLAEALDRSIAHFKQRLVGDPDNARLHYSLGVMYSRAGRIKEGIEHYTKAVSLDPDDRDALFNLASSYAALGEDGWAVTYYERMLAVNAPDDAMSIHAYRALGDIYRRQGEEARAEEYFRKAASFEASLPGRGAE